MREAKEAVLGLAAMALALAGAAFAGTAPPPPPTPTTPTTPTTATPAKVALTPNGTKRSIPFGLDRDPKTITLTYSSPSSLAAGTAVDVVLDDLRGEHDVFPASQVTTAASIVGGGTVVKVSATFDPKDVKSGTYSGDLRLASTAVSAPAVGVTAELSEHAGKGYVGAFLVIFLGVLVGLGTKWLSDTGVRLGSLRAQLSDLSFALNALRPETLPPDYVASIAQAWRLIDRGDAAAASLVVEKVTGAQDALVALSRRLALIEDDLQSQRALIAGTTDLDETTRRRLLAVVDVESAWPAEIATASWPEPSSTLPDQQAKSAWVDAYTRFLRVYVAADATARAAEPLRQALEAFHSGDFAGAMTVLAASVPPVPADDAEESSEAAERRPGSLGALVTLDAVGSLGMGSIGALDILGALRNLEVRGLIPTVRRFLADHAGLLVALLFGLLVALVGLNELYSKDPDAGESISDWVGFFAWGFAIELTGITTAQAALRLAPSGSAPGS